MAMHYFDPLNGVRPLAFEEPPLWLSLDAPYIELEAVKQEAEALRAVQEFFDWPEKPLITADGAEAIAAVLFGHLRREIHVSGKSHLIYLSGDIAPIEEGMKTLKEFGCYPISLAQPLSLEQFKAALNPRVCLVSLSLANPVTGWIHPLAPIAEECRIRGIALHVDVTAAVGKLPLEGLAVDYITVDGAPLRTPIPCGIVLSRHPIPPHTPGRPRFLQRLLALEMALDYHKKGGMERVIELGRKREFFEEKMKEEVPACRIVDMHERLPHLACIDFPGVHNDLFLFHCARHNIFPAKAHLTSALSFAFAPEHTFQELAVVAKTLGAVYAQLIKLWERP